MATTDWQQAYETGRWKDLGRWNRALPAPVEALLAGPRVAKGRALDIGCGPGLVTAQLCRFFPIVVGIDYIEAGIRIAVEETHGSEAPPSFVAGDAFQLPFADESFDYVFDGDCLPSLPMANWQDYFSEVRRVLKSGGYFQVLSFYYVKRGYRAWIRRNLMRHLGFEANWRKSLHRLDPGNMAKSLPQGFTCETLEPVRLEDHPSGSPPHTNIVCRRP